jgi:predicted Zn-dependent protease
MRWLVCLAVLGCGGAQAPEKRVADLKLLSPATLEAIRPREGDPRTLRVRVWADAGVRALPRWRDEINEQIDYASQLLVPLVGVQLSIDKVADWKRTGAPSDALRELNEVDDGEGVGWVIGYVTPGHEARVAFAELGDAQLLGKHVVVRGWAERAETDALAAKLPDLDAKARDEVLAAHARHKQTVVLLHMLARTLGAIEVADPAWLQHPTYSPKQSTLSDRNRALVQLAIDARVSGEPERVAAHGLLERIEKEEWGGWSATSRDEIVARLRSVVIAAKEGEAAPEVPAEALGQYERVKQLGKRGQIADALAELDNMMTAYPGNAAMQLVRCELMIEKPGLADTATRAACARVSELAPGDPSPHLVIGDAFARAGDVAAAHRELAQAQAKLVTLGVSGTDAAWQKLIAVYEGLGALTWTEDALAAAKLDPGQVPTGAAIAAKRARYGVPCGPKVVKPEAEAALVAAVRSALDLIYANKYAEAERALAGAEKKWPGAAGLAAARCDLALRQGNVGAAKAACARALAAHPDASWALYLSGIIALKDTSAKATKTGVERLRRAIEVDPELGQAWRTLAKAYARTNDDAALAALREAYAAKFGQALP